MTGSGTEQDPYIIENVTDLQNIQNDLDAWYELGGHIDASATSGWNGGAGFNPIGRTSPYFTGHFDGKSYSISDLYINRVGTTYVGLFGVASGASISHVTFKGCYVKGNQRVGTVAGQATGYMSDVHAEECQVIGQAGLAGLVGFSSGINLSDCDYQGRIYQIYISWHGRNIGGLFGYIRASTVQRCFASIRIQATSVSECIGGLFGDCNLNNNIDQCYAKGNIYVTFHPLGYMWRAGGFAGRIADGTNIDDAYSRVNVSVLNVGAGERIGGFSGEAYVGPAYHINNVYSTGLVNGHSDVGGLNGYNSGPITNSFWDTETSGQGTSAGGTGKTTAQMKTKSTFTDAGWNFTSIWDISPEYNNGYPILRMLPPQFGLGGFLWTEGTKLAYTDASNLKRTKEGTTTGTTGKLAGLFGVKPNDTHFYYIDSSGAERKIEGVKEGATGKIAGQFGINTNYPTKFAYIDGYGDERHIEGS